MNYMETMTADEYMGFQGAENFADGSMPLIAYPSRELTVIVAGDPDSDEGAIVGAMLMDIDDGEVHSYQVAVHSKQWGQAVANELIECYLNGGRYFAYVLKALGFTLSC